MWIPAFQLPWLSSTALLWEPAEVSGEGWGSRGGGNQTGWFINTSLLWLKIRYFWFHQSILLWSHCTDNHLTQMLIFQYNYKTFLRIVSINCRKEGCIGKYIPQGLRDFPKAGICTTRPVRLPEGNLEGLEQTTAQEGWRKTRWRGRKTYLPPGPKGRP